MRVNAFGHMENDNRSVNIGGRRASTYVNAWLNCDTWHGEVGMYVSSQVTGTTLYRERRRLGSDNRRAIFSVELPRWDNEAVCADAADVDISMALSDGAHQLLQSRGVPVDISLCQRFLALRGHLADCSVPRVGLPCGMDLRSALAGMALLQELGLDHEVITGKVEPSPVVPVLSFARRRRRILHHLDTSADTGE